MRAIVAVLLAVGVCVGGCVPMPVSSACREQVSACLAGCPSRPAGEGLGAAREQPVDTRSTCERNCHDLCY